MKPDRIFLTRRLPDFCLTLFIVAATVGAFTGGMWAALGIGGAIIMTACVWRIDGRPPLPARRLSIFMLGALLILALLNLRSTQPVWSWHVWLQLLTIFVPLGFLTSAALRDRIAGPQFFKIFPLAAMIGACAIGAELALQGPLLRSFKGPEAGLFQYDRGFSYIVLLSFPALAILWTGRRRWLAILFIVILFVPAGYTASRAAKLALILGLLTTGSAMILPLLTRYALMIVPVLAAGWPFAAQFVFDRHRGWIARLPNSWQNRLEIWDYLSYRIAERPWLGWGLGSSRFLPLDNPHSVFYRFTFAGAPHPHNAVTQLWVELGLPGLLLGIAFAWLMLARAANRPGRQAAFALGAWMAGFCLAMISYNFWSDSLWAAYALTGLAGALRTDPLRERQFANKSKSLANDSNLN